MAIDYEKVNWSTSSFVNPDNMNHMDEGIKQACDKVDTVVSNNNNVTTNTTFFANNLNVQNKQVAGTTYDSVWLGNESLKNLYVQYDGKTRDIENAFNDFSSFETAGNTIEYVIPKDGWYLLSANALALAGSSYLRIELRGRGGLASAHKNSNFIESLSLTKIQRLSQGDVIDKITTNCEERGDSYNYFQVIFIGK